MVIIGKYDDFSLGYEERKKGCLFPVWWLKVLTRTNVSGADLVEVRCTTIQMGGG